MKLSPKRVLNLFGPQLNSRELFLLVLIALALWCWRHDRAEATLQATALEAEMETMIDPVGLMRLNTQNGMPLFISIPRDDIRDDRRKE